MAKKKKAVKKFESVEHFLNHVATESQKGDLGYCYTTPEDHQEALQAGLIEINAELTNDDDTALATMLTEAGLHAIGADVKPESEYFDYIPPKRHAGRKAKECPVNLEDMEVGKAIFVPDTESKTGKQQMFMHVKRINDKHSHVTEAVRLNKLGLEVPKKAHDRLYKIYEGEKDGVKGCIVTRTK